jgi:hypothetical protein
MRRCASAPVNASENDRTRSVSRARRKDEKAKKTKKSDPVSLYQSYKKHWDKFTVPGADPRTDVRLRVRSKFE